MTALHKKINKLIRPKNFAVILGENPELVSEMSKIFRTVFVYYDNNKIVRERNVVYRAMLANDEKISEVEAIIIADLEEAENLKNLHYTIAKERPKIIVYSSDLPKESICKWLGNEMGYRITHQEKQLYVWMREQ